jgi:hypothetical protein
MCKIEGTSHFEIHNFGTSTHPQKKKSSKGKMRKGETQCKAKLETFDFAHVHSHDSHIEALNQ